jgi:VanZ family protein
MHQPSSAWRSILLAAIVSLILFVTLRPFNFRVDPEFTSMRIRMVDWAPLPSREHESLFIDVACNILLFFPYGAAFYIYKRRNVKTSLSILSVTVSAAFLSSLCETLQVWLPDRYPQVLDVVANTSGALAGAITAAVWERIDTLTSPGEVRNGIRWSPDSGVLLTLLVLSLLYPAFHLDPVRSVNELEAHAKAFIQSPLFDRWSLENVFLPLILLGALSFSIADWAMKNFPSLRLSFTYFPAFLLSFVYAVLLPIPRIFFRSFSPNWGSILFGVLGVSLGIMFHRRLRFPPLHRPEDK